MKYFFFLIMLLTGRELLSQNSQKHKYHRLSLGYGYRSDDKWVRNIFSAAGIDFPKHTDDAYFRYESGLTRNLSLGLEAAFISVVNSKGQNFMENFSCRINAQKIQSFFRWYLIRKKKLSVYSGLGAGFYTMKYRIDHSYPSDRNWMGGLFPFTEIETIANRGQCGFAWSAEAGIQFFFSKHFGAFCTTGTNKSVFQVGLIFMK